MFDFNYYTPTKVVFGRNTENQVADLVKEFGGTKVLNEDAMLAIFRASV